jgi:hypothetical protein
MQNKLRTFYLRYPERKSRAGWPPYKGIKRPLRRALILESAILIKKHTDFEVGFVPMKDFWQLQTMDYRGSVSTPCIMPRIICPPPGSPALLSSAPFGGRSMKCAALTLLQSGDTGRELYLSHTFDGWYSRRRSKLAIQRLRPSGGISTPTPASVRSGSLFTGYGGHDRSCFGAPL